MHTNEKPLKNIRRVRLLRGGDRTRKMESYGFKNPDVIIYDRNVAIEILNREKEELLEKVSIIAKERDDLREVNESLQEKYNKSASEFVSSKANMPTGDEALLRMQQQLSIAEKNYWLLMEDFNHLQDKLGYLPFLKDFISVMRNLSLYNNIVDGQQDIWVKAQIEKMIVLLEKIGVVLFSSEVGSLFNPEIQICKIGCVKTTEDESLSGTIAESIQSGIRCDGQIFEKEQVIKLVFNKKI